MEGKFFLKPHFLIRPSSLPCHGTRLLPATLQYVELGGFWCSLNQTRKGNRLRRALSPSSTCGRSEETPSVSQEALNYYTFPTLVLEAQPPGLRSRCLWFTRPQSVVHCYMA